MIDTPNGIVQVPNTRSDSVEFLLAEYNQMTEEIRRVRQEGLNRLNFFITITSSTLAGLVVLSQSTTMTEQALLLIALGACAFLLIVGWNTFQFIVTREINTDANIRATARIRRFFLDHDPALLPYLSWQTHDEPTPWIIGNTSSSLKRTAQMMVAVLIPLMVGIGARLLSLASRSVLLSGLLAFAIALLILSLYASFRFRRAASLARQQIRFSKVSLQAK